jgi:hypothetical protein
MSEVKITIEGTTKAAVVEAVVKRILDHEYAMSDLQEKIDEQVGKRIERAIGEVLDGLVEEVIKPRVMTIVEEGWPIYDTYGANKGTKSLRDLVRERLLGTDRYTHRSSFMEVADKIMRDEAAAVVKQHAEELRKGLDEKVAAQLRETVARTMLGK